MHDSQRLKRQHSLLLQRENEWLSFPVLTAVQVVCRHRLPLNGDQSLARIMDVFLDEMSGSISLSSAYKTSGGSLRLLQYLTSHELPTTDPILHRWEFNNVTGEAAAQGDLRTLQWLVERYRPEYLLTQVVAEAVGNGHLHILEWLWENHRSKTVWGGIELCLISMNYHPDVIHWLRARTEIPPEHAEELVHVAAENGDVELVRVLHNAFEVEMNLALFYAVEYHRWEVVYWILDNCKLVSWDTFNSQHVVRLHKGPIRSGNLAMLQRLFDRGLVLYTENILEFVDRAVTLKAVKWLHFHTNTKCSNRAMDEAAARGDLDIVQWLHTDNPWLAAGLSARC